VRFGLWLSEAGPCQCGASDLVGNRQRRIGAVEAFNRREDEFGIAVAGALRSDVPPEKIIELQASALSGDWRTINGDLELVALLAVNTPGFPIPRKALAASGALVAAGVLLPSEDDEGEMLLSVSEVLEMAAVASGEDRRSEARIEALERAVIALAAQMMAS